MEKSYYRYLGYSDGSGRPAGLIVRCYTPREVDRLIKAGFNLERMPRIKTSSGPNFIYDINAPDYSGPIDQAIVDEICKIVDDIKERCLYLH